MEAISPRIQQLNYFDSKIKKFWTYFITNSLLIIIVPNELMIHELLFSS